VLRKHIQIIGAVWLYDQAPVGSRGFGERRPFAGRLEQLTVLITAAAPQGAQKKGGRGVKVGNATTDFRRSFDPDHLCGTWINII
jgi:hypothetical protein